MFSLSPEVNFSLYTTPTWWASCAWLKEFLYHYYMYPPPSPPSLGGQPCMLAYIRISSKPQAASFHTVGRRAPSSRSQTYQWNPESQPTVLTYKLQMAYKWETRNKRKNYYWEICGRIQKTLHSSGDQHTLLNFGSSSVCSTKNSSSSNLWCGEHFKYQEIYKKLFSNKGLWIEQREEGLTVAKIGSSFNAYTPTRTETW